MTAGTVTKTAFANKAAAGAYNKGGDSAQKGKIWHLPGEMSERGFRPSSVFGSYGGSPDMSQPIAAFASVKNPQGTPEMKIHYYDNHEEKMREWRGLVDRYGTPHAAYKQIKNSPGVAAVVNAQTIDATKSLNILDQVLGLQVRNFYLEEICTKIAANNLVFTVDRFTEGTVEAKVPEMKEPRLISHEEERTTKILYKNVGHIAESEEARLLAIHNTTQLRQDKTTKDMGRLLNAQIGVVGETATNITGRDWGATSGTPPDSSNNPINDLEQAKTLIKGNGFNVDYVALHDRAATDLMTNKFIQGRGNTGTNYVNLGADQFTIPGLPPVIVDQGLSNTVAIMGNKEALWLGEGPTVVAAYEEEVVGFSGWLIKQWRLPYLAEPAAIRKLSGVSA